MKIAIYTQDGDKEKDIEIDKIFLDCKVCTPLLKEVIRYQNCNTRKSIAHVKTKSDVKGGGKKPYRQKGTGRARQGSIRNPHYKGGGVAFGPKNIRNFNISMPKKQRRKALRIALKLCFDEKKVFGLTKYDPPIIKTKDFNEFINKLPGERNMLIVVDEQNEKIKKVSKNLPNVKTILWNYLNVIDLLHYDKICLLENSIDKLKNTFFEYFNNK